MPVTRHTHRMEQTTPDPDRFKKLPPPVRLEETVEVKDESPVPDPNGTRDTETEFMLRHGGG